MMMDNDLEPEEAPVSPPEVFRELAGANETEGNPEAAGAYRDAANYLERSPMFIEPELNEAKMRMRQHLGDGEINGEEFDLSMNIDGMAMFVEFEEERVMLPISDLPRAGYMLVYGERPPEENDERN
jgi:hypothetical protein